MRIRDDMPFNPGLEPFASSPTITTYPSSEILIREQGVGIETSFEAATMKRGLVEELPSYGIPIPHTVFVAAERNYYIVTEKLDGRCFKAEDYSDIPKAIRPKAEQFIDRLLRYVTHKIDTGDAMMNDIYGIYQSMYVPAQDSFVLVDLGETDEEPRQSHISRFEHEASIISSLMIDAYLFFKDDPTKYASWHAKGVALLRLSAERNGVVMPVGLEERLITAAIQDISEGVRDTIFEKGIEALVASPENQPYRDRMETLRLSLADAELC